MNIEDVFVLPVSEEVIEKTQINVVKKYNYTCKSLMYHRTPVELLDNLYMGDMAKNALFDYLKKHCSNLVVDYDEVRTDNFEHPDPGWDILIDEKKLKVEIKSSIPPNNESKEDILFKRDIKITASHDNGHTWILPDNIESDIHVQIYFYARPYKNGYSDFSKLSEDISKDHRLVEEIIHASKYNQPIFFGFNTKENIVDYIKHLPENKRTWTFSWTDRVYWACPIKMAFNMDALIKIIDGKSTHKKEQSINNNIVAVNPQYPTNNMNNSNILSINSMLPSLKNSQLATRGTFVGIDFGTSTTVVSIASCENGENKIKTLPIKLKQILEDGTVYHSDKLPSVIAWYNGSLLVGEGASNLKYTLTKGKNIWFSFKMEIGEDLGAKYYNSEVGDTDGIRIRNPKDCVRVFFMYLRMLITKYCQDNNLSDNIHYAVSIPASFEANQRKELMEALDANGMTISKQSLIDEPNAAFISYVHDSEDSEKPLLISPHYNSKALVFDFGGGTCDISILEIGKSATGLYSKNIAISKFTKLGGDDIDRYITYKYIMPRFFEYNKVKESDFRTKEKQFIATQLYKVSERLKILLCKKIANKMYKLEIPTNIKSSTEQESITVPIMISTLKGSLSQDSFYLTPKELCDAMAVFMKKSKLPLQVKGQEDYNNISMPIESAIKKANVSKAEIDYVLLIGGSAQNPFIQEYLKNDFEDSQILVPQDLQTHVSKGAAIHSYLMNGMNKCIIQPITSEPIMVITKDTHPRVIMPAGSIIPSDTFVIDDLVTSKDNQKTIELPICVGSPNKMLYNLKIELSRGCPVNTPVALALEVNADKLLLAQASCMGVQCMVEPQNPFANKELTTEERIVLVAERQANLEAELNHGTPTKNGLRRLREAYEQAGNSFRAAETYELETELYPSPDNYNAIGVLYSNAGVEDKAIEYYERALEYSPENASVNFNLGHHLIHTDPQRARKLLAKSYSKRPNDGATMIAYAEVEAKCGNTEEAKRLKNEAYDILMKKWKAETLASHEYSWLASLATDLGHRDIAFQVRNSKPGLKQDKYYDDDNLTRTKSTAIEKL